ncbi:MAG: hypothetical protein ACFUZC_08015 [Chthoniobacteraceae bacterium]
MINKITSHHYEHVSARSFDEVVALFAGDVGSVEEGGLQCDVNAASDASDFESASGLTRIAAVSCAS